MATEAKKPPKGILKKSPAAPATATAKKKKTAQPQLEDSDEADEEIDGERKARRTPRTEEEAREIAVQHAHIIHSRRQHEDAIADNIILLAKLPTGPPAAAHNSSSSSSSSSGKKAAAATPLDAEATPDDVATFKSLVRAFQPSDYDDLLAERNALGRCGYVLCGRPARRLPSASTFKLVNWGRADFGIVPREELERWCSASGGKKCARRAMYVKVQLNETAAWERAGIDSIAIDLLEEVEAAKEEAEKEKERRRNQQSAADAADPAPTPAGAAAGAETTGPPRDTSASAAGAALERERVEAARREKQEAAARLDSQRKAARDARDLAIERGDIPSGPKASAAAALAEAEEADNDSIRDDGDGDGDDSDGGDRRPGGSRAVRAPGPAGPTTRSVKIAIREKRVMMAPQEPGADAGGGPSGTAAAATDPDGHLVLDGYRTKFDPKSHAVTGLMPSAKEEALREAEGAGDEDEQGDASVAGQDAATIIKTATDKTE